MANQNTVEYAKDTDPRTNGLLSSFQGAVPLFNYKFSLTAAAGAAADTISLRFVPAGRFSFFPRLSFLQVDALGAARTLDFGTAAYTDEAGNTVAAALTSFDTGISIATATTLQLGASIAAGTGGVFEYNSRSGITFIATVQGGTIPVSTKFTGSLCFGYPGGC
jgi:hypothetical protein